ncbi:MAG TPA: hypothetical protein DCZ95_08745 [Verrucomicrobia bacterium]|nr:MAG: hypothetical protein A2X46_19340 [Lentisphaerae bacterium GWF2_57_35]HBA84164.1 hypothetical protein [Verrucomicrobiota bacterium]
MKKIVLADDDPIFRSMLKRVLEKDGFVVIAAQNGLEALLAAVRERPDMVLLDLDMPEMHGLEALRRLKARSNTAAIPIIVLTGIPSQGNVIEALQEGAQDFIAKTSDIENLLLRIQVNAAIQKGKGAGPGVSSQQENIPSESAPVEKGQDDSVLSAREALTPAIPSLPAARRLVSEAEFEARLSKADSIKALPFVASRIMQLTEDKFSDATVMAREIEKDPSIASKVFKAANSAFHGMQEPVISLERAVVSLGVSEVRDLVFGTAVVNLFTRPSAGSPLDRISLWQHSFCCASYARRIAQHLGADHPETFFLSGLLHRLGMAVYDEAFHEEYAEVLRRVADSQGDIRMHEMNLLGHDHVELTRRVLEKWHITRQLKPLMGYGLSWSELMRMNQADRVSAGILPVCDILTLARGLKPGAPEKLRLIPDVLALSLDLSGDFVRGIDKEIDKDLGDLWSVYVSQCPGVTAPPVAAQHKPGTRNRLLMIREIKPHLDVVEFWLHSMGYDLHVDDASALAQALNFDGLILEASSLPFFKTLLEQLNAMAGDLCVKRVRVIILAPLALEPLVSTVMGPETTAMFTVFSDPYSTFNLLEALS